MTNPPGSFERDQLEELYRAAIQPIFVGQPQEPSLDDRNVFYLQMLARHGIAKPGSHLVDLGAGLSIFGPMMRKLGLEVTLVDDFGGGGGVIIGRQNEATPVLDLFRQRLGIRIVEQNFVEIPLALPDASVDAITCFHSLEHWHNSPKRLFREITRVLRPRGFLVLATPNAVNIRKRAFVLIGRSNFPTLHAWYDDGDPVYRGHVREPVIRDLHQILQLNNFELLGTYGRNFIGRKSHTLAFLPPAILTAAAVASDYCLRLLPSLCSDIHVVGQKRA